MSGSKLAIGESTLAELIITSVLANNDFETFHRLSQVSRRFNRVAKSKLIIKNEENIRGQYKRMWTQLPDGRGHGLYKVWDNHGNLVEFTTYIYGLIHGPHKSWFPGGEQISYESYYFRQQKHGLCKSWWGDGTLQYSRVYNHGTIIVEKLMD